MKFKTVLATAAAAVLVASGAFADGLVGIALPLFVVTMASQSIPGLAVLHANGYRPPVGPVFAGTGLGGLAILCSHRLG